MWDVPTEGSPQGKLSLHEWLSAEMQQSSTCSRDSFLFSLCMGSCWGSNIIRVYICGCASLHNPDTTNKNKALWFTDWLKPFSRTCGQPGASRVVLWMSLLLKMSCTKTFQFSLVFTAENELHQDFPVLSGLYCWKWVAPRLSSSLWTRLCGMKQNNSITPAENVMERMRENKWKPVCGTT
jgi:hypothetical protein